MLSLLLFLPIFILPVSEMFHFVFPYTWQPPPCPDYSGQKCLGFSCDVINHHQYNFNSIRHCCHTSYNNIKSPSRNPAYVQYKTRHCTLTSRYFPGNYKNWHLGDKARLDTGNSERVEIKESGQERGERRDWWRRNTKSSPCMSLTEDNWNSRNKNVAVKLCRKYPELCITLWTVQVQSLFNVSIIYFSRSVCVRMQWAVSVACLYKGFCSYVPLSNRKLNKERHISWYFPQFALLFLPPWAVQFNKSNRNKTLQLTRCDS